MIGSIRILTIILLLINGLSALVGGFGLIGDPTGKSLGWSTDMLEPSPFEDFLVPGIILFVGNGLMSLAIAIMTMRRMNYYPVFVLFQGVFLCGWIAIQMVMLQFFHLLHLICGVIGVLIIICSLFLSQNERSSTARV